ncbi:sensor histidine kinase [Cohnella thailandensis]|uniref:histidine kinase n=1 Tax=Cohnella thailandensis TaxID=557557 RepID=A0A841SRP4_9BACL|nr:sensor histidine kinase [Cohnella thailandensis]MBB6633599.1 sensor histidine kinase [Cohnella thailandensis]MBP1974618.1 two-component system sensor histidine kinase YesM [Cohnella thailandensis]
MKKLGAMMARWSPIRLRTLRSKLLLTYLAAIAIPLLTLGIYSMRLLDSSLKEQSISVEKQDLLQIMENAKSSLNSFVSLSSDISYDPKIWRYFYSDYDEPGESMEGYYTLIRPLFARYLTLRPEIRKITIYTKNDTLLYNRFEIAPVEPGTYEAKLYDETLASRKVLWKLREDSDSGEKLVTLSRMLNLNNVVVGMVVLYIDENQLYGNIRGQTEGGEAYLLGPDGAVLSSTDRTALGQPYGGTELDVRTEGQGLLSKEIERDGSEERLTGIPFALSQFPNEQWALVKTVPQKTILAVTRQSKIYQLGAFALLVVLLCLISVTMSGSITRRIKELVIKMRKVERGDFDVAVSFGGQDEVSYMGNTFNAMAAKLNTLVGQVYEMQLTQKDMELKNRESELKWLQSQINPHFLFNTLDAVLYGIRNDKEETAKIVEFLANSFRRSIQWTEDLVSLEEELKFIKEYLAIQRFRMPDKFAWQAEVPAEALSLKLPKMLLQPLVENAVHHGLSLKKEGGSLLLKVEEQDKGTGREIVIRIRDDGVGIEEWRLEEIREILHGHEAGETDRHIGLKNVYDRIRLYYGDQGHLEINSVYGEGTEIEVRIPVLEEEDSDV